MSGRNRRAPASDLSRAIIRFEQWRQGRTRGSRIPASLWNLAVKMAGHHGAARTAAALKLDYYSLKDRLMTGPLCALETKSPSPPPAFVELAPGPLSPVGPCVIEFSNGVGATLRVQLPTGQMPDLVALGRSFWDAR